MKIMLIQAEPCDDIQDFNFPMGYAALDSVLTKNGHSAEIVFTIAYHLRDADIAARVRESDTNIFGIGGMWPYLKRVEGLVKLIRETRKDAVIILGGWMSTYLPELVLKKTGADFIIAGEGELALLHLMNAIRDKKDYSEIRGLVYYESGKIHNNGMGEMMPLDEIPMPNWHKFPMEYYLRVGAYFNSFASGYDRVMGWATSRGCPSKCNFCTPGRPRYKKISRITDELREIVDRFHPSFFYSPVLSDVFRRNNLSWP